MGDDTPWACGYKVLQRYTRRSLIMAVRDWTVTYPRYVTVWARFGCGPLAVFADYQAAVAFVRAHFTVSSYRGMPGLEKVAIVLCLYKPSAENDQWVNAENGGGLVLPWRYMPAGSRLADDVLCLE